MTGQNAAEIRTAANGNVLVAPAGTAAPTDPTSAYGAGWVDLGFTSENGVKFKDDKTTRDQTVWQSFYRVGIKILSRVSNATLELKQWNKTTVPLAFGGGAVTSPSAGVYKYTPPAPEFVDYRAMGIDWVEGSLHYRLICPKGLVDAAVETTLARTDDAILPIEFGIVGVTGASPWFLLTDDPAFA